MANTNDTKNAIKQVLDKIREATNASIAKELLGSTANFLVGEIFKRTKAGYGVSRNLGTASRLKPLSKKYIDYRRRSFLSSDTTPGTSNLTFSGQMLASLSVLNIKSSGYISIGLVGSRQGSSLSNDKVAKYQEEQGRTFNRFSEGESLRTLQFYRRSFNDLLKRKKLVT